MAKTKTTTPKVPKMTDAKHPTSKAKTAKGNAPAKNKPSLKAKAREKAVAKTGTHKPASGTRRPRASAKHHRPLGKALLRFGILAGIWIIAGLAILLAFEATQLPDISNLASVTRPGGVRMVSSDGREFASYGAQHGRPIEANRLPRTLINALLATEDRRFHDHFGVDPISIARAMLVNLRAGRIRQGGSTLTQQLAKNLFLGPDRSLERKIQELLLAFWLEASFSKQQILTIYLNRVYFGAGAYGVDAAARKYFGKPIEKIGLYESALLAGLLKAPTRYNPVANPKRSAKRTRQVLLSMVDAELLSQAAADAATSRKGLLRGTATVSQGHRHFADWALGRASNYTGPLSDDRVVHTTLDRRLQGLAETAVAEELAKAVGGKALEAAVVVMGLDGAVLAMVGGRDHSASQFNRATQAQRQPGSAFKPFVYLAALSVGYTPESIIEDAPLEISGWKPRNFDGRFRGSVTLRRALAASLNVATVRLSETIGRPGTIRLARRLGMTATLGNKPSLALGAGEVTVLELTAAYAALANGGTPLEAFGITSISTSVSGTAYRHRRNALPSIASPEVVKALDGMLKEVVRSGTGKRAAIGRPAAGKTGTSQDHRDAWFVGYTGDLVAGVWVGRDDAKPMKGITGGGLPAEIWARFMRGAFRKQVAGRR
ncbi:MAG: PBP1A family penicillin-binding protein [Alphaproteobacteria bacterium]|nr:PBP1A family penicillin-binding protein [Alphaproteobacteria bacterium]